MALRHSLVTGGAGFVGGHLVNALRDRGDRVRVLDVQKPARADVDYVEGSVTDPAVVAKAAADVDSVFHLAAYAHLWAPTPKIYSEVNIQGVQTVARAAASAGARLTHVSSFTTLVGAPLGKRLTTVDESNAFSPSQMLGPYPRSKRAGELAVLDMVKQGLDARLVLPTAPIGPGDASKTPPTRMIADFIAARTPVYLECMLNFIDVRDLAAAIVQADAQGVAGERYVLGGETVSMSVFLSLLEQIAGAPTPKKQITYPVARVAAELSTLWADVVKRPPSAPRTGVRLAGRKVIFNSAKARDALGLRVRPLETSLKACVDWLDDQADG